MKTETKQSHNVHITIVPHSNAYLTSSHHLTLNHVILLVCTSIVHFSHAHIGVGDVFIHTGKDRMMVSRKHLNWGW